MELYNDDEFSNHHGSKRAVPISQKVSILLRTIKSLFVATIKSIKLINAKSSRNRLRFLESGGCQNYFLMFIGWHKQSVYTLFVRQLFNQVYSFLKSNILFREHNCADNCSSLHPGVHWHGNNLLF